jgi:hypothetical protein
MLFVEDQRWRISHAFSQTIRSAPPQWTVFQQARLLVGMAGGSLKQEATNHVSVADIRHDFESALNAASEAKQASDDAWEASEADRISMGVQLPTNFSRLSAASSAAAAASHTLRVALTEPIEAATRTIDAAAVAMGQHVSVTGNIMDYPSWGGTQEYIWQLTRATDTVQKR